MKAEIVVYIECDAPGFMFKSFESMTEEEREGLHPIPCEGKGIGLWCEDCKYCENYEWDIRD